MPDDHSSEETPFSSESDSANDATKAEAIEEATAGLDSRKPAGALKFLTIIMLLLVVGLIAGPFIWGLSDLKKIAPDPSVLNPWTEWLGDMHVVVLHIPIGIFFYVFVMEILGLLSFRKFKPHLGAALALNSITAVVAVVFGYFLFLQGDRGNAPLSWSWENNVMGMHMWLSIIFAVFVILSFVSKMWSRHHNRFSPFYPVFMLLAAASMTIGAHMGGQLVHGKDKDIVGDGLSLIQGESSAVVGLKDGADVTAIPAEERLVYSEIVKPILQGKCWECHAGADLNPTGKRKVKGGLDMTSVELLLKGGKNADEFPTLEPGNIELSEMLARVHLDVDDEDFMPKGKEDQTDLHLTEGEIRILEWWIAEGSEEKGVISEDNDRKLKEVEGHEAILADVKAFRPVVLPKVKEEETAMPVEDSAKPPVPAVIPVPAEEAKLLEQEEKQAKQPAKEEDADTNEKIEAEEPLSDEEVEEPQSEKLSEEEGDIAVPAVPAEEGATDQKVEPTVKEEPEPQKIDESKIQEEAPKEEKLDEEPTPASVPEKSEEEEAAEEKGEKSIPAPKPERKISKPVQVPAPTPEEVEKVEEVAPAEDQVEQPIVEEKAEEVADEDQAERPIVEEKAEEVADEDQAEQPIVEEKAEEVADEDQAERPIVEEKAEEVADEDQAERPIVEEKAEEVADEDQAEQPIVEESEITKRAREAVEKLRKAAEED